MLGYWDFLSRGPDVQYGILKWGQTLTIDVCCTIQLLWVVSMYEKVFDN